MENNKELIETIKIAIKIMKLDIIKKIDKLDQLLENMDNQFK